jgi:hypothetical protein
MGLQQFRENQYLWTLTNLGSVLILSLLLHLIFYLVSTVFNKIKKSSKNSALMTN